eukprot:2267589-Pyramimonas_sp.AAC.1
MFSVVGTQSVGVAPRAHRAARRNTLTQKVAVACGRLKRVAVHAALKPGVEATARAAQAVSHPTFVASR